MASPIFSKSINKAFASLILFFVFMSILFYVIDTSYHNRRIKSNLNFLLKNVTLTSVEDLETKKYRKISEKISLLPGELLVRFSKENTVLYETPSSSWSEIKTCSSELYSGLYKNKTNILLCSTQTRTIKTIVLLFSFLTFFAFFIIIFTNKFILSVEKLVFEKFTDIGLKITSKKQKIGYVFDATKELIEKQKNLDRIEIEKKILEEGALTEKRTKRQVLHDIKSPFTALKVFRKNLNELIPPVKLRLFDSAFNRINFIMKDLTEIKQSSEESFTLTKVSIYDFFNEKKLETTHLRKLLKITYSLKVHPKELYLQLPINVNTLFRILSNLINNSVEEIVKKNETGKIELSIIYKDQLVKINILDSANSLDISTFNLACTHEYSSKSPTNIKRGNGLSHAYQTLKESGGSIELLSPPKKDKTQISLTIPIKSQSEKSNEHFI